MKENHGNGNRQRGLILAIMKNRMSTNEFYMSRKGEALRIINHNLLYVNPIQNESNDLFKMLEDM